MGFLTFIFWCIVVFYTLGLLGRWLLKRYITNKQREFESRVNRAQQEQRRKDRHEGDVTVERIEVKEKHVNNRVGEYIEYEEVEEVKENGK